MKPADHFFSIWQTKDSGFVVLIDGEDFHHAYSPYAIGSLIIALFEKKELEAEGEAIEAIVEAPEASE